MSQQGQLKGCRLGPKLHVQLCAGLHNNGWFQRQWILGSLRFWLR